MKKTIPYIHLYQNGDEVVYRIVQVDTANKSPQPPKGEWTTLGFFPEKRLPEVLQVLPKTTAPTYMFA
jgi:hypothetical protein